MTHVAVTRDQVVAVVESINQPQISIPTKVPQAAQAHLVGLRNPNGTFSIFVGLYLRQTGENVIYSHERREIPVEAYPELEQEGLHFLESMGFMLDNTHFRNLAPEGQEAILRRVPLFSRPRPAAVPAGADARSGPRHALARLLAGI